jgi:mersacidin/lichenicidin family type 2 lantibiotic
MSNRNTIRAWKDEDFRLSLSEAERRLLPRHPAGLIEVSDEELRGVAGGNGTYFCSFGCSWLCVPTAACTPGPYCHQ